MSDTLGAEQDGIEQVHVRRSAVAERLASMEDERYMDTKLLLPVDKLQKGLCVVYERLERVLVPDEVEARE